MKKTIKFLQNGEYEYATVIDVGDLDKLMTSTKTTLVDAINEIIGGGLSGTVRPEQIQQIQDQVQQVVSGDIDQAVIKSKEEIQIDIDKIKADVAAQIKEVQDTWNSVKQDLDNVKKDYVVFDDVNKAVNDAIDVAKKDASQNFLEINEKIDSTNDTLESNKTQLQSIAKDLATSQTDLHETKVSLDETKDLLETKVSKTDYDKLNDEVSRQSTDIQQNAEGIKAAITKDTFNTLDQKVKQNTADISATAEELSSTVKSAELTQKVNAIEEDQDNLITQSRSFGSVVISNPAEVKANGEEFESTKVLATDTVGSLFGWHIDKLTVGDNYVFSIYAKTKLPENQTVILNSQNINKLVNRNSDWVIKQEWARYWVVFQPDSESIDFNIHAAGLIGGDVLSVAKPKLERGKEPSKWSENINDFHDEITLTQSHIDQTSEQIDAVVEKQKKTDDAIEDSKSSMSLLSDRIQANVETITKNGEDIKANKSLISTTAEQIKTTVQENTNNTISSLQGSSTNLILNSKFTQDLAHWDNVSDGADLKEVGSFRYLHFTQSGLTKDLAMSATSNPFVVTKDDDMILSVSVIVTDVTKLDNQNIMRLAFYDSNDNRVDYKDLNLAAFNATNLASNHPTTISYKFKNTREDVAKARIIPILNRNGEILFTQFYVRISSFVTDDWQPAPEDSEAQQLELKTEIKQNKDSIEESVTNIKQVKGDLDSQSKSLESMSNTIVANKTAIEKTADGIKQSVTEVQKQVNSLNDQETANQTKFSDIEQKTGNITSQVGELQSGQNGINEKLTKVEQTANGLTSTVSQVNDKIDGMTIGVRNLIPNSKVNATSSVYGYAIRHLTIDLTAGDIITLTINGHVDQQCLDDGKVLRCSVYEKNWNKSAGNVTCDINTLTDKTVQRSWTVNFTGSYDFAAYMTPSDGSRAGTTTLNWATVVVGNKAPLVWFPAPEDQATVDWTKAQLDLQADKIAATVTANDVTGMLNGYATQSWSQGQISAAKNEISASVETVQTQVQNSAVGTNLLRNSRGKFQPNMSKVDNYVIYFDSTVYMTQGQQYTVHADASSGLVWSGTHNPSVENNNVVLWLINSKTYGTVNAIISDANTGTGTTFTWNYPSGTYYLRVNTYKPDNSGYVESVKIEKGTTATDWCLAPEDQATIDWTKSQLDIKDGEISAAVTSLKSDITNATADMATQTWTQGRLDLTASGLTSQISSVQDGLNEKYTSLEQTLSGVQVTANNAVTQAQLTLLSNQFTSTISGIQVGGTNLIPNSSTPQVIIRPDQNMQYPMWAGRKIYTGLKNNETYTFSALATAETTDKTAEQWGIQIFQNSGSHQVVARTLAANTGKRQSVTFTTPDDGISYDVWVYAGAMGESYEPADLKVVVTISDYKLETGTLATDWSPAPEDLADTQQVATLTSQIEQTSDQISLKVGKADLMTTLNNDATGITISPTKVHITGQTEIDNGIITNAMIQAKSITADKLDANTLAVGLNTYGIGWQITPATLSFHDPSMAGGKATLTLASNGIVMTDLVNAETLGVMTWGQYSPTIDTWFNGFNTIMRYHGADYWAVSEEVSDGNIWPVIIYSRNYLKELNLYEGLNISAATHFKTIGPMDPDAKAQMKVVRAQVGGRWSTGFMNSNGDSNYTSGILFSDVGHCFLGRAGKWYDLYDIVKKIGIA